MTEDSIITPTEEKWQRFRPHIVVHLGGKRYELNPKPPVTPAKETPEGGEQ